MVRSERLRDEHCQQAFVFIVLAGLSVVGCTEIPDVPVAMPVTMPERAATFETGSNNLSTPSTSSAGTAAASSTSVDGVTPPQQSQGGGNSAAGSAFNSVTAGRTSSAGSQAGTGGTQGASDTGLGPSTFGVPCESDMTCLSGMCVKGHCCSVRECGTCERCGSDGRCAKITNEADPYTCDESVGMCDASGTCMLKNGSDCSAGVAPGAPRCASGVCDARCCAITCGVCKRCNQSGAGCEPVVFADDVDSCSGTLSCSNGECVEVAIDTAFNGNQWMLLPGEEIAQTFNLRVAGELVEIRVDTSCSEVLSLRQLTDDWNNRLPPDQELLEAQPRPSDARDPMVSYVINPALRSNSISGLLSCFTTRVAVVATRRSGSPIRSQPRVPLPAVRQQRAGSNNPRRQ